MRATSRSAIPVLMLMLLSAAGADAETLAVVVNDSRGDASLSLAELKMIYRGEIRFWKDRTPVRPILPPRSDAAGTRFFTGVLGRTPAEFDREWKNLRFRGVVTYLPIESNDIPSLIRAVSTHPGFIAIIANEALRALDESLRGQVRVVAIDGKRPGDVGYPLD